MLSDLRRWFSTRRTLLRRLRYAEDALTGHVRVVAKLREENEALRRPDGSDIPPPPDMRPGWFRVDCSDAGYGGPGWMRVTSQGNDYRDDAIRGPR